MRSLLLTIVVSQLWAVMLTPGLAAGQTGASTTASRSTAAVTYEARRTTKVDMIGTPLLPRSRGEAQIETESAGPVKLEVKLQDLTPPTELGAEYLTYVLWAIPPQGRPKNLGELRVDGGRAEIAATANTQTFALIVTAEPYYAVTTPSDVVVVENAVRKDTRGDTSIATLQYEIVPRGAYVAAAGTAYTQTPLNKREPPDLQQARNAIAIAVIAQADKFANGGLVTARRLLTTSEQMSSMGRSSREIISQARAAVQAGEEARLQAVRASAEEQQRLAREASAAREDEARARAQREAAARADAEASRAVAEQERLRAEQMARQAEQDRQRAEQAARDAAVDRQRAEQARADAQAETARAQAGRAESELKQSDLRAMLLKQFSEILETRDTARGLIVNVGDVLFETGRYELRAPAREKLARFAGIILAHPGLAVQAEGFTDSTGTLALNQKLSEQRADAVGGFLTQQGLPSGRITTRGYGPEQPVASNDTSDGRQKNRRVELVVAGEIIGTPVTSTIR